MVVDRLLPLGQCHDVTCNFTTVWLENASDKFPMGHIFSSIENRGGGPTQPPRQCLVCHDQPCKTKGIVSRENVVDILAGFRRNGPRPIAL